MLLRGISKAIQECRDTRASLEDALQNQVSINIDTSSVPAHKVSPVNDSVDYEALTRQSYMVVVSPNEVNSSHGTGVLLNRIFPDSSDIISIRTHDHYGGLQPFGAEKFVLRHDNLTRSQSFKAVNDLMGPIKIDSILLVPYHSDEWLTALALKQMHDVPLLVWIMDDTINVYSKVDYHLAKEVLSQADLCVAISREMADSYEARFGVKFWVAPPVIPHQSICSALDVDRKGEYASKSEQGVLVGNAWSQEWLERLGQVLVDCGQHIDWYGGGFNKMHNLNLDKLETLNIHYKGFLASESEVSLRLRDYGYLLVPNAVDGDSDQFKALSALSLPSRIPFAMGTANLPTLVVQDRPTAAGNFVTALEVGVTVPYAELKAGIEQILAVENQKLFRMNAAKAAQILSAENFEVWIRDSLQKKEPADFRFEKLLPRLQTSLVRYHDWNEPTNLYGDFKDIHIFFRRLKRAGYKPDFVVDVGASVGIWSEAVHRLYPESRFILIDPLFSQYDQAAIGYYTNERNFEFLEVAVGATDGEVELNVSPDLYGSSIVSPNDFRTYVGKKVPLRNLDSIAREYKLDGRGVLKLDVQYAEALVVQGAVEFINQIDVLVVEVGMVRKADGAKLLSEFIEMFAEHGLEYFDDLGGWRDPLSGFLTEKDVAFVRKGVVHRAW